MTYLEVKAIKEIGEKLASDKEPYDLARYRFLTWLEQQNISISEYNEKLDSYMEMYDRQIASAEIEYDKAMDKIRPWKKIRKEFR